MRENRKTATRWPAVAGAFVLGLATLGAPGTAQAQFDFFQPAEVSVQDIYDTIAEHGFRLAGPLTRNGAVYVADVYDRRNRRERLIIGARNARIVQRYLVDVGPARRDGFGEPAPAYEARRQPPDDGNFFSRLTRGFSDDGPPPRPPEPIEGVPSAGAPHLLPVPPTVRPRPSPEPRVVRRRDDAPITSAPLPAPTPVAPAPVQAAPATPVKPAPALASVPANPAPVAPSSPPVPAATSSRPVVIVNDPLRIPGKEPEPATTTAATNAPKPAPKKPAASGDVPVAPLE